MVSCFGALSRNVARVVVNVLRSCVYVNPDRSRRARLDCVPLLTLGIGVEHLCVRI